MARQRMVNPAFFVDEEVARLSLGARLLFIGLWTLADKRGRLEDRPPRIKLQLLGYDQLDVEALLSELAAVRFVTRYQAEGKKLLQIRSFAKHQRPHPKEPDTALPGPPELAVEKHGKPELAGRICPESESVPSESESKTESESDTESEYGAGSTAAIETYAQDIVSEFYRIRGYELPEISQREYALIQKWGSDGIPLRVVLRGMADCCEQMRKRKDKPDRKPLGYYDSAVREAYRMWQKAVPA